MTTTTTRIDFWYDSDCPNAALVRRRLDECLRRTGRSWIVSEHRDAGMVSPTIMVNGVDVGSLPTPAGPGCRLDLPSVEQICYALEESEDDR